jgi:hypothetical protein
MIAGESFKEYEVSFGQELNLELKEKGAEKD